MLAAGKPVVSVALTDLMPMASAGHIALAETAEEFVRSIEIQVLQDTAIKQQARQCSAAENTWTSRLSHLDQAVRSAFPKATIIVVTYNNLALNRLCLESLLNDTDYPNYEIVVVDNASSDGTLEYLSGIHDSRFTMIHNKVNLGFAAANNQGLKCARGDFLCLLNNDTVVTGSWLSDLVKHLQIHPDIGLIGPVTNSIGNEAKISVDYRDLVDLPKWSAQYCEVNKGRLDDISMLAFFCVVMPRAVFECVGLLDERFGLGMFEDDDYNRRVRAAGYKALLARDVYVHHWQRASFKLLGEDVYHEIFQQNRLKYQSKWIAESLSQKDAESLSNLLERSKNTPKTIIFAPSIGWSIHLFQRPHHLARAFSRQGYMVVFDCTGSHEKISFLEEIEHGLFLYSGKAELLAGLHQPVLWTFTYNYGYRDYFQKDIPVVYDWIDDLSVFPYDQTLLAQAHARAMSEAAVVCSVAKRLHCAALKDRSDAIYLPNAVEQGRFDRIPDPNPAKRDEIFNRIASSKKFIAGYYGALAEWFDYELLVRVAELRQDWYFVLIGPDHDGSMGHSTIGRCSNIVWLGPRDYADLPGYLNLFDVAIIPFKINDITLATSPLKLFEYFAGGKPVLTTQMPECMAFGEVFIAQNAEEFALLLDPARCAATDQKYTARLENLAELNSWEARTQVVLSALSSQGARSIMNAFRDKESIDNKNFFRALASHLSDIADDPRLSMYFNFALSTNDRGREVARLIAKHIEILGKLHLDIGCAYGGFLVAFAEHGAESFGFDIDPTLLGLAERNFQDSGRNFRIYQKDVTRWEEIAEFKGKFDIITCNDVIEHVSDPATAFEHIALLLNEGGVAYFEIPNRDAAPFVLSDGHYQLFGITQLDKADAADYFSAHAPGVPYTVEHYLRLPEYRELMGRVGLSLEVLPESLANVGRQAIENIADDIESSFEDRLLSVPASIRDKVSESVRTYLSRIKSDASFTDREKRDSYLLTYGVSFWKIVARKVCIEPERAVFEKAGSSTLEEKSNV